MGLKSRMPSHRLWRSAFGLQVAVVLVLVAAAVPSEAAPLLLRRLVRVLETSDSEASVARALSRDETLEPLQVELRDHETADGAVPRSLSANVERESDESEASDSEEEPWPAAMR